MKTNTRICSVSKADTLFQYPTTDTLWVYFQANFTTKCKCAPLVCTQTVSIQSKITLSFSSFTTTLTSLMYYHQYLSKRKMNTDTISRFTQTTCTRHWKGKPLPTLLHSPAFIFLCILLHQLEKLATGKWIWRRLLSNYLVRFQSPNNKGQSNNKKREKEIIHAEIN